MMYCGNPLRLGRWQAVTATVDKVHHARKRDSWGRTAQQQQGGNKNRSAFRAQMEGCTGVLQSPVSSPDFVASDFSLMMMMMEEVG